MVIIPVLYNVEGFQHIPPLETASKTKAEKRAREIGALKWYVNKDPRPIPVIVRQNGIVVNGFTVKINHELC